MRRRWQSRPPLLIGNQGGKALKMASRPFQFWEKNPAAFSRVCPQVRDILSRSLAWDEGRGLSYTPCLLMKPVLRLRLHATQSQPRFPAASNALALPGGNGIFTATPTERITHYTLQAKSCAKGCPFGNPGQQNRLNISHFPGAWYSAFICCQQPPFRGLRVVPCKLT